MMHPLEARLLLAGIELSVLSSHEAGQTAEIVAHDPQTQRLFAISAADDVLTILNIARAERPRIHRTIDLSALGSPNSVAVHNGIVAVALDHRDGDFLPGSVAFFKTNGQLLNELTVGATPDMVVFTPDGSRLLVANEGQPSSYNEPDSIDGEGSVSIIHFRKGLTRGNVKKLKAANVATASFAHFNDDLAALRAAGVRIFGPNATVAQDVEPEYISIAPDGRTAYVTLQENNAIATLDIPSATITAITPLGYKYHGGGLETFEFTNLPALGTTAAGQSIKLGGFSGLFFEGINPANGNLKFITHTDRGPNPEPLNVDADSETERPFALPTFQPELVRFELNRGTGQLALTQRIGLTRADGTPLTGLPNMRPGNNGNLPYNDEEPVNIFGQPLALDPFGGDLEGIAIVEDGSFWMADEYRPALYHFDATGRLLERHVPRGTAAAAGLPEGAFGVETLPAILANRRGNRGFEGVALQGGKVYGFVQSSIRNPASLSNAALNALRNVRIVELDPASGATRQFLYVQDPGSDKIGDALATATAGQFMVMERDDLLGAAAAKNVWRIDLAGATDISSLTTFQVTRGDQTLTLTPDQMTPSELAANDVKPVSKAHVVDLGDIDFNTVDKAEGLALVDGNTLAVINDNDFQLDGTLNTTTGMMGLNNKPELLGLITLGENAIDASDRDSKINIANWPVFGMYQPDTIAAYSVGGQTLLVMTNEGDAREYTGFEEETRVGSVDLDPTAFPNAEELQDGANLGRLRITNTQGDTDGDGDYDQLYSFGARSFSIRAADGTLIFDSGDLFEQITAAAYPEFFNASNSNNDFDDRSDDKGPEAEGLTLGTIDGRTYAFVALERIGGITVFDITNPAAPVFLQYINNRDFTQPTDTPAALDLGPEGLKFIPAEESPTGRPLLAVANEISGTVTLYSIASIASPAAVAGGDARSDDGDSGGTTAAIDVDVAAANSAIASHDALGLFAGDADLLQRKFAALLG